MTRLHSNSPRRSGTRSKRRQVEGGAARPRHCKGDQADVRRAGVPGLASRPRSSTELERRARERGLDGRDTGGSRTTTRIRGRTAGTRSLCVSFHNPRSRAFAQARPTGCLCTPARAQQNCGRGRAACPATRPHPFHIKHCVHPVARVELGSAQMKQSPTHLAWPVLSVAVTSGAECVACGSRDDLVAHHKIPRRYGGLDVPREPRAGLPPLPARGSSRRPSHGPSRSGSGRTGPHRVAAEEGVRV